MVRWLHEAYSRPTMNSRTLLLISLLALFAPQAHAQMGDVQKRNTEAGNEGKPESLRGNVHPLARREFDQGAVADAQSLRRMLLVLQRSPEVETTLRSLLEAQQD